MEFSLEQYKEWLEEAFPDNRARAIAEANFREGLAKMADFVFETNSSSYIQESLNQVSQLKGLAESAADNAEAKRLATELLHSLVQGDKSAVEQIRSQVQLILDNALTLSNPQGDWSAANEPALSQVPVAGANGTYFDITVSGLAPFSGSNFTNGLTSLEVGGKLIKKNETQWFYQGPSNAALASLNGSKVRDSGALTSVDVPEIQYQHVRGEAEMIGNTNTTNANAAVVVMYEQLSEAIIFNKVRLYARMVTPAAVTVRIFKATILRTNMSNATFLAEKVIPVGGFNVDPLGYQEITFDRNIRLKAGEFVYIGLATDGAPKLGWRSWNVASGTEPARHGYLFTPEIASPWTVNMSVAAVPAFGQAAFELSKDNSSNISKKSFEKTKHFSVNKSTGRLLGVSIPSIQYQNPRGNYEITGVTTFSGATYYGFGHYEKIVDGASFNTIDTYMRVVSPQPVTMKIFSGTSIGSSLILANQKLLHTKEFAAGEFNSVEGAIFTIKLSEFIHVQPEEYVYVLFYCATPNTLQSRRFTTNSATEPFRHSYLVLSDANGVPADPWGGTWGYSSIASNFWGTTFKLYISDDNSGINARLTAAEAQIAANTSAIGNALTKNADGSFDGSFVPEFQYQHIRGTSEMIGNAAYSSAQGLGFFMQMPKNTVFNKLELPLYVRGSQGTLTLRVYKGVGANDTPASMTLLQAIDILAKDFNRVQSGTAQQVVSFDYPVLLKTNEYLHVYAYCDIPSMLAIRYFNVEGSTPIRTRFKTRSGTDPWGASWGNSSGVYYTAAMRLSLVENSAENRLKALEDNNPRLAIPSKVYAVAGFQFTLYYDAMVLGKDAGLQSPSNYFVAVACEKGEVKERYWRITPNPEDVGSYPLTVSVFDLKRNLVAQKTISLTVSAAVKPGTQKYVIDLGDSTIADSNSRVAVNENYNALPAGLNPIFLGTAGGGATKSEAFGGSRFIGHISETMGISGGSRPNSLWNPNIGAIDTAYYKSTVLGHSGSIDQVNIQLGINDSRGALKTEADVNTIIDQSKTLVNAWLALDSNVKVIVHLPLIDVNVMYAGDKVNYQRNLWRLRELIIQVYDEFAFSPRVYVGQAGLCVDRYYGYRITSNPVGRRYPETEYSHTDNVHPRSFGYQEMGDAKFAQILTLLQA